MKVEAVSLCSSEPPGEYALPPSSSSVQTSGTANCGRADPRVNPLDSWAPSSKGEPLPEADLLTYEPAHLMQDSLGNATSSHSYAGDVSLAAWPHVVLRNILQARTAFSFFVKKAIHHCRDGVAAPSSSALFPIPLPRDDVWNVVPKKLNKAGRLRLAHRKMLHLCILGLNYVHFESPLGIVQYLGRCPNGLQSDVFKRILAFIKAGGPSEHVSILSCGRKSHQLDARFRELEEALRSLNLFGRSPYGEQAES